METTYSKNELRQYIQTYFAIHVSSKVLAKKSKRISEVILKHKEYHTAHAVLFYMPLQDEVDIIPVILHALKCDKTVLIPKCVPSENKIMPCEIRDLDKDIQGGFAGILEPVHENTYNPQKIDVVIVPGRAFDHDCYRLGRGGGYYDRFFIGLYDIFKMGISFDFQVVGKMVHSDHDVPVDCVVTDRTIIKKNQ